MTQRSRIWDGNTGLGAPGDAGPYSSANWRDIEKYNGLYSADGGVLVNSGVVPNEGLTVSQSAVPAMSVLVSAGRANVQGGYYESDANETLIIAANASGNPRIDSIILRADFTAQTIRLAVLQGTPAASPVPPTLTRTAATYEISIADVDVANGAGSITNAVIWNYRLFHNAANGLYHDNVENRSGGSLRTGDLVYWVSTGTGRAVTTSSTTGKGLFAGVWVGYTASLGYGRVQYSGLGLVRVTGTLAWGTYLIQSSTAKIAAGLAIAAGTATEQIIPNAMNVIGRLLQATTFAAGNGLALADIKVVTAPAIQAAAFQPSSTGNNTTASATFVDATDGAANVLSVRIFGFASDSLQLLIMTLSCALSHTVPSKIDFDYTINGNSYATDIGASDGLHRILPAAAGSINGITWQFPIIPALSSGWLYGAANTIILRWKTGAATATMYNANVANQDYPISLIGMLTG